MRYHCPVSIDRLEYEGLEFADQDTPMSILEKEIEEQEQKELIDYVMSQLTETQRRRIQMKADGLTLEEIAEIEGVHFTTIDESIKAAKKKANKLREKYFKKF
jgi:sigma-70, region 4